MTLALHNCYDPKQWHDVMRVTLARAAPIAAAFDCELATIGFPYAQARARGAKRNDLGLDSPKAIAQFVSDSSTIGDGAEHLVALERAGRFHVLGFDERMPARFGRLVATTPSPAQGKATTPREVASQMASGQAQTLLFGLGPRGLPADILDAAPLHLELTGRGIHLDTAAALGALPAMLRAHESHLAHAAALGAARTGGKA